RVHIPYRNKGTQIFIYGQHIFLANSCCAPIYVLIVAVHLYMYSYHKCFKEVV
ncbi:hypothetical protein GIB67_042546, partial [Kingdonia uniflora]